MSREYHECKLEFRRDGTRVVSFGSGDLSSESGGEQFSRFVRAMRCLVGNVSVGREVEYGGVFDASCFHNVGKVGVAGGMLSIEDGRKNSDGITGGGLGGVGTDACGVESEVSNGSCCGRYECGAVQAKQQCEWSSTAVFEKVDGVDRGCVDAGLGGCCVPFGSDVQVVGGKQSKKNARKRARAKALKAQLSAELGVERSLGEMVVDSSDSGEVVATALHGKEDVAKDVVDGGTCFEEKRADVASSVIQDDVNGIVSGLLTGVKSLNGGSGTEIVDGCRATVAKKASECVRGVSYRDVTTVEEQKEFARQWYERKCVENSLAIQRAKYNVKRNNYLDRSRISEQRWETERLNCDAKLARISESRLGCVVGSAKTVVSDEEKSLRPPSLSTGSDSPAELSDGTVSPDSSISVAEGVRLSNKVKKVESENAELKLKYDMLIKAVSMGGSKIVIDGKNIHEYDGTGQYVPPFEEEVESLYDGRGHLLDAWEAGMDY